MSGAEARAQPKHPPGPGRRASPPEPPIRQPGCRAEAAQEALRLPAPAHRPGVPSASRPRRRRSERQPHPATQVTTAPEAMAAGAARESGVAAAGRHCLRSLAACAGSKGASNGRASGHGRPIRRRGARRSHRCASNGCPLTVATPPLDVATAIPLRQTTRCNRRRPRSPMQAARRSGGCVPGLPSAPWHGERWGGRAGPPRRGCRRQGWSAARSRAGSVLRPRRNEHVLRRGSVTQVPSWVKLRSLSAEGTACQARVQLPRSRGARARGCWQRRQVGRAPMQHPRRQRSAWPSRGPPARGWPTAPATRRGGNRWPAPPDPRHEHPPVRPARSRRSAPSRGSDPRWCRRRAAAASR